VLDFELQLDSHAYAHNVDHTYSYFRFVPDLPERAKPRTLREGM
jgi:hypothetical protein